MKKSVPKDAAAIIINAPQKDFNKNDAQKVIDYLQKRRKSDYRGNAFRDRDAEFCIDSGYLRSKLYHRADRG